MASPTPEQLRFILESGILAPSADNHHLMRFDVRDDILELRYTGGSLPEAGGYKRVLAMLSLGAVSENLTVAASRFAIQADLALFPDPLRPDLILRVNWQPGSVAVDPLWEEISRRHTNRSVFFRGPPMSHEDRSVIERAATHVSGSHLEWLEAPKLKPPSLKLIRLAEGERFRNRLLHEELFSNIRFDVGWQHTCEEGLPPAALGIERPLRHAFAWLRHWPLMRLLNLVGGYWFLGWRAADLPCRLAPHLGLIAVDQGNDHAVFAAGRSFQRVWLAVTRLGLALQPMPASALFSFPGAIQEGIPKPLQQHLSRGWQAILPNRQPVMLFRIGRADSPATTTGRMPLQHYAPEFEYYAP
ncbi:MAG: hypothetical protein Q8K52_05245 [Thiobacillus sp.]|nr:hypothetical protein [Thiobacillus sp.]